MSPRVLCIEQLLEYIKLQSSDLVANENLCEATADWGLLLRYPVDYDDVWRVDELIRLESSNPSGKTPLAIALEEDDPCPLIQFIKKSAKILLTCTGPRNRPIYKLQGLRRLYRLTLEYFFPKILSEASTTEEFIQRFLEAGCSAYHAVYCKDTKVIEALLERGMDVNFTSCPSKNALLTAAIMENFELVKIFVNKGADVHARNIIRLNVLYWPIMVGDYVILDFLLNHGANINDRSEYGCTPLLNVYYSTVATFVKDKEKADKCAELLLLRGALPQNSKEYTILGLAQKQPNSYRTKLLISHIAMMDLMNTRIIESLTGSNAEEYHKKHPQFGQYHDLCQQVLVIPIFKSLRLLDLLNERESKMRLHVRNENFVPKLAEFYLSHDLAEQCPLYFKKLEELICKATRIVKLENTALPIIFKIFDDHCYIIARLLVSYLNEQDLQRLCSADACEYDEPALLPSSGAISVKIS